MEEAGLSPTDVEALILKQLLIGGTATGRKIAEQIRLPFGIMQDLCDRGRRDPRPQHEDDRRRHQAQCQQQGPGSDRHRRAKCETGDDDEGHGREPDLDQSRSSHIFQHGVHLLSVGPAPWRPDDPIVDSIDWYDWIRVLRAGPAYLCSIAQLKSPSGRCRAPVILSGPRS